MLARFSINPLVTGAKNTALWTTDDSPGTDAPKD
jgi:hypothetical protein